MHTTQLCSHVVAKRSGLPVSAPVDVIQAPLVLGAVVVVDAMLVVAAAVVAVHAQRKHIVSLCPSLIVAATRFRIDSPMKSKLPVSIFAEVVRGADVVKGAMLVLQLMRLLHTQRQKLSCQHTTHPYSSTMLLH